LLHAAILADPQLLSKKQNNRSKLIETQPSKTTNTKGRKSLVAAIDYLQVVLRVNNNRASHRSYEEAKQRVEVRIVISSRESLLSHRQPQQPSPAIHPSVSHQASKQATATKKQVSSIISWVLSLARRSPKHLVSQVGTVGRHHQPSQQDLCR